MVFSFVARPIGISIAGDGGQRHGVEDDVIASVCVFLAQGGLSVAGGCRCLTKDGNTSIEKEGYIPYPLQA